MADEPSVLYFRQLREFDRRLRNMEIAVYELDERLQSLGNHVEALVRADNLHHLHQGDLTKRLETIEQELRKRDAND